MGRLHRAKPIRLAVAAGIDIGQHVLRQFGMIGLRNLRRVVDRRIQAHLGLITKREVPGWGFQAKYTIVLGAEIGRVVFLGRFDGDLFVLYGLMRRVRGPDRNRKLVRAVTC